MRPALGAGRFWAVLVGLPWAHLSCGAHGPLWGLGKGVGGINHQRPQKDGLKG